MDYTVKPREYHVNKDWYNQRNVELYRDKMDGMSNLDLVLKYRISPSRIQYLIRGERSKRELRQ